MRKVNYTNKQDMFVFCGITPLKCWFESLCCLCITKNKSQAKQNEQMYESNPSPTPEFINSQQEQPPQIRDVRLQPIAGYCFHDKPLSVAESLQIKQVQKDLGMNFLSHTS